MAFVATLSLQQAATTAYLGKADASSSATSRIGPNIKGLSIQSRPSKQFRSERPAFYCLAGSDTPAQCSTVMKKVADSFFMKNIVTFTTIQSRLKDIQEFTAKVRSSLQEARRKLIIALATSPAALSGKPAHASEGPIGGGMVLAGSLFTTTLGNFIQIYVFLLTVRVVLTWLPNLEETQPVAVLKSITDPYLNLFRGLVPPIGGIDISPILAFLLLQFFQQIFQ
mmetsp:Transcript_9639/g.16670  ORF Transcript_9639/g.16670 Transcript_9639/m.16670 type:complete len:225 (-) Transcript_9639:447-1121(-)|eukprot:CAMPEP_0196656622 /NCGR_PEP_ID=MMETSP1086-20130531/18892_1 /TAXON_ID=77921 /ORGANISM="Cyanoptyche  gloeocystis , Strain SAG4.97" /LENGTH=224 /DNA_ID=CAMNT_0041989453 /DNA_START=49 /DNA_END=723 /DNA_ORIENTATION=+